MGPELTSIGAIVRGIMPATQVKKTAIWTGPRKVGLMISSFLRSFLLCKKAASSNKHHSRSVQLGSHRMSIESDFFSNPAKLKIAWVFKATSVWLMQMRSKNTRLWGRHSIIAREVTRKPAQSDQHEYPMGYSPVLKNRKSPFGSI